MKKKNILKLCFFVIALFVGFTTVEAKTYTAYEAGDKITVNVNDSTKLDFYVVADSSDEEVTAIYESVLGDSFNFGPTTDSISGSVAETKLNELTANWDNPSEIRLIKVSEIDSSVEVSKDLSKDFTTPSYYHIGNSYWTQDIAVNGDTYYPIVVTSWISYSNLHATQSNAPANDGAIRPVITISKDYVVGGTTVTEDDELWNDFVDEFKVTDLVKTFEEAEGNTVNITSTSDSLKIVLSDSTNTWTTNFTYSNGIITYVSSNNEDNVIVDSIWIFNCLYTLSNLKGYDFEKVADWSNEEREFTLENDGVEFETKEYNLEDNESMGSISISGEAFSSFKLDIKNGLKSFSNNADGDIENPSTGDATRFIMIGIGAVLVIGAIAYKKTRKYS